MTWASLPSASPCVLASLAHGGQQKRAGKAWPWWRGATRRLAIPCVPARAATSEAASAALRPPLAAASSARQCVARPLSSCSSVEAASPCAGRTAQRMWAPGCECVVAARMTRVSADAIVSTDRPYGEQHKSAAGCQEPAATQCLASAGSQCHTSRFRVFV